MFLCKLCFDATLCDHIFFFLCQNSPILFLCESWSFLLCAYQISVQSKVICSSVSCLQVEPEMVFRHVHISILSCCKHCLSPCLRHHISFISCRNSMIFFIWKLNFSNMCTPIFSSIRGRLVLCFLPVSWTWNGFQACMHLFSKPLQTWPEYKFEIAYFFTSYRNSLVLFYLKVEVFYYMHTYFQFIQWYFGHLSPACNLNPRGF